MRKFKYSISKNALNQMYMYYLLPVVEYASVAWDGCSERDSQTLQKIQNEAARLVTGLTRFVSCTKSVDGKLYYKEDNNINFLFMYKVNAGLVPSYISDSIPPLVSEILDYLLRNSRNISLPYNRTNISQKSYIPSSIRLWNGLDDDFQTFNNLQKHVISKFNKSYMPSYFTFGNR